MTEETIATVTHPALSNTDLAFERTMLAHERTLMAWIRTAISMISFGFTIYKFFQEMNKAANAPNSLFSPRVFGMVMISFGLIALILAQIQHQLAVRKLKENYPSVQKSISSVMGVLVLIFGLVLFLGALFRQ
jgi:putative membrane protein